MYSVKKLRILKYIVNAALLAVYLCLLVHSLLHANIDRCCSGNINYHSTIIAIFIDEKSECEICFFIENTLKLIFLVLFIKYFLYLISFFKNEIKKPFFTFLDLFFSLFSRPPPLNKIVVC